MCFDTEKRVPSLMQPSAAGHIGLMCILKACILKAYIFVMPLEDKEFHEFSLQDLALA